MRGPVPPIRIYIYVLLQRLGVIAGNHFNGPYKVTERVLSLVSEFPSDFKLYCFIAFLMPSGIPSLTAFDWTKLTLSR